MSEFLTIEPADPLRGPFAVWALARDPKVQTVGTHGFVVPLDWYPDIPVSLLEGAYVDGYLYNRPEPVKAEAQVPLVAAEPVELRLPAEPLTAEKPKPAPRKRAARKRAPRKPKDQAAP